MLCVPVWQSEEDYIDTVMFVVGIKGLHLRRVNESMHATDWDRKKSDNLKTNPLTVSVLKM